MTDSIYADLKQLGGATVLPDHPDRAELERVYPTSLIPIRVKAARMASERLIAILETGICRNIMNSLEMNA